MADTLPNIFLPPQTWIDLYASSGIAVGEQILTQNIGSADVYLASQLAEPVGEDAHQIIERSQFAINDPGDNGAWAYCRSGSVVNVRLA